jgi:hypothetical protein
MWHRKVCAKLARWRRDLQSDWRIAVVSLRQRWRFCPGAEGEAERPTWRCSIRARGFEPRWRRRAVTPAVVVGVMGLGPHRPLRRGPAAPNP